jgi:hypothetical protein
MVIEHIPHCCSLDLGEVAPTGVSELEADLIARKYSCDCGAQELNNTAKEVEALLDLASTEVFDARHAPIGSAARHARIAGAMKSLEKALLENRVYQVRKEVFGF